MSQSAQIHTVANKWPTAAPNRKEEVQTMHKNSQPAVSTDDGILITTAGLMELS